MFNCNYILLEQTKYNPIIKMILFFLQHVSFPSFVTHFKAETFLKQNILFINIILEYLAKKNSMSRRMRYFY